MSATSRAHVLLLADGLVHDDRFTTGAARCAFEAARALGETFRVTLLASARAHHAGGRLTENVWFARCERGAEHQVRAALEIDRECRIDAVLALLDQTLPVALEVKRRARDLPPVAYWLQVEPGPMHSMQGLEAGLGEIDSVLVLTQEQERALLALQPRLSGRTRRVPIGIRAPVAERGEERGPAGRRRVLFIGRLAFSKGYDVLLAATEHLLDQGQDVEVRTVGEFAQDLPAIALQRRNRLLCAGRIAERPYLSPSALWQTLARSDVLVLPSRTDCMPVSILEAWNLGVPVVASALPNLLEMDRGRGAIRFPTHYSGACFAECVRAVLAGAPEVERGRAQARELARTVHSDAALSSSLGEAVGALLGGRVR